MNITPILIVGAGRLGGAVMRGWLKVNAFSASALAIRDTHPGDDAKAAIAEGAIANPADLAIFSTVLLAVKPQVWRAVASDLAPRLSPGAVVVSVMAGVAEADLLAAFQGQAVARVMPTTGVRVAEGVASIYAGYHAARSRAHALFHPIATTADLEEEAMMDGATAISGSAPAYLYALIEALEAAGVEAGLPEMTAKRLVRATMASASILLRETGEEPSELRRQVASPNGVTEAALRVMMAEADGLPRLVRDAVSAAVRCSRALGAQSVDSGART